MLRQLVKDIDNRITILIERGGAPIIFGTERKGATDAHAPPLYGMHDAMHDAMHGAIRDATHE